jgi:hypothetical protein
MLADRAASGLPPAAVGEDEKMAEFEMRKQISGAFVGMTEVYLTDLWCVGLAFPFFPRPSLLSGQRLCARLGGSSKHRTLTSQSPLSCFCGFPECSFDPLAPEKCDLLLGRALEVAPEDPEAWICLASVRMSQEREADARECVGKGWSSWRGRELGKPLLLDPLRSVSFRSQDASADNALFMVLTP